MEAGNMVYPYATLSDTTEVVHSEMRSDGRVKVYFEKAVRSEERRVGKEC